MSYGMLYPIQLSKKSIKCIILQHLASLIVFYLIAYITGAGKMNVAQMDKKRQNDTDLSKKQLNSISYIGVTKNIQEGV